MRNPDLNKIAAWTVAAWLAVAVPMTILAALVYGGTQQNYRTSANDPQIQMAEDAAAALERGADPAKVVPAEKVEMARSLSPFLIILDDRGNPLASSGELDGKIARPPLGVLDVAREQGESRVTWQPRRGVRIAAIVRRFGGEHPGFVTAGRSLREVEVREAALTTMVGIAWVVALLGCGIASLVGAWLADRASSRA